MKKSLSQLSVLIANFKNSSNNYFNHKCCKHVSTNVQKLQNISGIVSSHNEWDPLEEIVVGWAEGCVWPEFTGDSKRRLLPAKFKILKDKCNGPFEAHYVQNAKKQVDEFVSILKQEGVIVRRPEKIDYEKIGKYKTPNFESKGFINSCPRDSTLIVGNEIIEAPMSSRYRYFDTEPMKLLFNEYFEKGAKWTLAPKPRMKDDLYVENFPTDLQERRKLLRNYNYGLTNVEPVFDAADVIRFGKDLIYINSVTSNRKGLTWLKRHLGELYTVNDVLVDDPLCTHIDSTISPITPGVVIVNKTRAPLKINGNNVKDWSFFTNRGWIVEPSPDPVVVTPSFFSSHWLSINFLLLGHKRVILQKGEYPLVKLFKKYGIKCIEIDFLHANILGGAFHCWTLDIRRQGELSSYF